MRSTSLARVLGPLLPVVVAFACSPGSTSHPPDEPPSGSDTPPNTQGGEPILPAQSNCDQFKLPVSQYVCCVRNTLGNYPELVSDADKRAFDAEVGYQGPKTEVGASTSREVDQSIERIFSGAPPDALLEGIRRDCRSLVGSSKCIAVPCDSSRTFVRLHHQDGHAPGGLDTEPPISARLSCKSHCSKHSTCSKVVDGELEFDACQDGNECLTGEQDGACVTRQAYLFHFSHCRGEPVSCQE